jgi:hypothetical protein
MTQTFELDDRVSTLEQYVRNDLSVRVDAMNSALGQTYTNTQVTLQDLAGIKVDLADLEVSTHKDVVALKTAFDLRMMELHRDLRSAESSIRHDTRKLSDDVNRRFNAVDDKFTALDERFNERMDGLEEKVDMIIALVKPAHAASQN